jgi:tetratricopeptide (TPR) repeat protein
MRHRRALAVLLIILAVPLRAQDIGALMRQADSAFVAENRALAAQLYRRVVALDEEQSRAVYRLGVLSANDADALAWFKRYAALERTDAWGWMAVGDRSLKLGLNVEAREAYRRAVALAPSDADARQRLERALLRAAATVEPLVSLARDSDGGYTHQYGLGGDVSMRAGWRLGARFRQSNMGDRQSEASLDDGVVRAELRNPNGWRLNFSGGLAQLSSRRAGRWATLLGEARARRRGPNGAIDVQVRRFALGTAPVLVNSHAVQDDARIGLEVPVAILRLRAGERVGSISAEGEAANRRLQTDAVAALPFGWRGEVSVQLHRVAYEHASKAGYFAPRRVETIESGTYWDLWGDGAVALSVDLGAGAQRLALQGAAPGPWKAALRCWSALSVDISRTLQWRVELEAYSAPFAPIAASTAPDWRYASLNTGLQVRLP